jgi:drug/metabolite transporter (DMT)-like permease
LLWQPLTVAAFLALFSALVYGCADFCGGKATRRAAAQTVTVSSQLVGFVLVLALAPVVPSDGVTIRALGFGALGGLAGAVGLMCLYHALSIGTMSIVSPVTAVVAASVPVVAGLLSGERLKAVGIVGIVLGLIAVVLVSLSDSTGGDARRAALFSLVAGLGFGFFFVALAHTGTKPGLWPLVAARPASMLLAGMLAARSGHRLVVGREIGVITGAAGVLDMAANVLFLYASQRGALAIVGVLSSLYPLSTVALARLVDHERLRRVQWAGLALAIAAVAAMSAS